VKKTVETPANRTMCLQWFMAELQRLQAMTPIRGGLVSSMLLYGEDYISRFARFCVPTLLSVDNREALAGGTRILFYTDAASYQEVWHQTQPLRAAGIDTPIAVLPPEMTAPALKYMALGTVHQVGFYAAGLWGAGYHIGQPDHVYSSRYFANLRRLKQNHPAIGQATVSANLMAAGPDLEVYRLGDGTISIGTDTLGAIAWRHLHDQFRPLIANGHETPDWCPPTGPVIWIGRDKLALYSPHMNIDYAGPQFTVAAPLPTDFTCFATIDVMWPYLCPVTPHQPTLADQMTIVELSGAEKTSQQSPVSAHAFAATLWHIMRFTDDYLDLMRRRSVFPIPTQPDGLEDSVIDARQAAIHSRLMAERQGLALMSIQHRAREMGWRRH